VNNAAAFEPVGPVWENDPDVWARTLEVNVVGPFRCARAVMPGMIARRQGRIVNLASAAGLGGTRASNYASAYATSKTGIIRLTEIMAAEAADFGVSVFAVSPGMVITSMFDSFRTPEGAKYFPDFVPERARSRATDISVPAQCCVFIASGGADALTGRYFSATEDYAALAAQADQIRERNERVLRLVTPR
jgi:NAD(P)-dependent dehydrogenase (short-subunit alcohol dehydrogenase family)